MTSELIAFTEYEEEICFDLDDPDFSPPKKSPTVGANGNNMRTNALTCSMEARVPSPMTIAMHGLGPTPVHMHETHSTRRIGLATPGVSPCRSLDFSYSRNSYSSNDYTGSPGTTDGVFSIEELRLRLNSCFTCGVSWQDEHVSLDCSECGGYSLQRPCPECEGQCKVLWKRDLSATHSTGKAKWEGQCGLVNALSLTPPSISPEKEDQLCQQLESLES